ncbi:MAG TPA: hypothetical protein VJN69_14415 [Candidatus Acidoferrales bacterium]|nr:hypothetical protein [Candidatus Acidoferrales bacterium]
MIGDDYISTRYLLTCQNGKYEVISPDSRRPARVTLLAGIYDTWKQADAAGRRYVKFYAQYNMRGNGDE